MAVITEIELNELPLDLREPFVTAKGSIKTRTVIVARLVDDDGLVGWGECVALDGLGYGTESISSSWDLLGSALGPLLLKSEVDPAAIDRNLRANAPGAPMARATLEMAAWDLHARQLGVSVSRALGGVHDRVPTGIVLGFGPDDVVLAKAQDAVAAGYRRVKVKIGATARLEVLAEIVGVASPDVPVAVDANGAFADAPLSALLALDELGLAMIEQPFGPDELERTAEAQRELRTPLCLDESIGSPGDIDTMARIGAGRIVNIKPGRVGGHSAARAIHDACRVAGFDVWCGGMLESGIGRAHNVALASLEGFTLPGDLSPSARYWDRDVAIWEMERGELAVPRDRPGLGIDVDLDALDSLTTQRVVLR